jgi:hypothetical protein
MTIAALTARLLGLVPRSMWIGLARLALVRVEPILESRASSDALRRFEVTTFASVYQILDSLAARPSVSPAA